MAITEIDIIIPIHPPGNSENNRGLFPKNKVPLKNQDKAGIVMEWLKKDQDFVLKGEPLAKISLGVFLHGKELLPYYKQEVQINLEAEKTGMLEIICPQGKCLSRGTTVAKIKKMDELTKYLVSQQEQLIRQSPILKQHLNSINVFYSYDHEDEILQKELEKHLSNLRSQHIIADWSSSNIAAGIEWQQAVNNHLDTANLILLLISPSFMASDYCYSIEMQRAIQRHTNGEAQIVPILLRPVDWRGTPFAPFQILPSTQMPITLWDNRDNAFIDVVVGIRNIIQRILKERLEPFQKQLQTMYLQMESLTEDYFYLETSLRSLSGGQGALAPHPSIVQLNEMSSTKPLL